jgi:hypothetical protein
MVGQNHLNPSAGQVFRDGHHPGIAGMGCHVTNVDGKDAAWEVVYDRPVDFRIVLAAVAYQNEG